MCSEAEEIEPHSDYMIKVCMVLNLRVMTRSLSDFNEQCIVNF